MTTFGRAAVPQCPMKHEAGSALMVYNLEGVPFGELTMQDGYEQWPDGVNGWKHALDCTVEPYDERTLEENLSFAKKVNKLAVVMKL